MRTAKNVTASVDPHLYELARATPGWPGLSALLATELRRWLREQGVAVPPPEPAIPLTEAARLARQARAERQNKPAKKKITKASPAT